MVELLQHMATGKHSKIISLHHAKHTASEEDSTTARLS